MLFSILDCVTACQYRHYHERGGSNIKDISFTFADIKDKESIKNLLSEYSLPHEDIASHLKHFLVAKSNNILIGVVGLEVLGEWALFRSLAVTSSYRGKGIGKKLYEKILAYSHLKGIKELYLLTTTAEGFFSKLGFCKIERDNIPNPIQATDEFQSCCPSTSVCMRKRINKGAQYYPKEILSLQSSVPGAKMWGVTLKRTMLTYFEVKANSRFERHRHKSEQITLVLKGELFFDVDERIISVKEGEVIAIPSYLTHAVFTKDKSVTAVDAWSPVMDKRR